MASILFKVVTICNSQFKCNYLKNEKHFLDFLFYFSIIDQILNTFKEKMIVIANLFTKLQTVKSFLENSLKSTVSEKTLAVNMRKRRKWFLNFPDGAFITFFIILSEVDLENVSPSVRWNLRGVC